MARPTMMHQIAPVFLRLCRSLLPRPPLPPARAPPLSAVGSRGSSRKRWRKAFPLMSWSSALNGLTYDPATIAKDRGQGVFAQTFLQFSAHGLGQSHPTGGACSRNTRTSSSRSSSNTACPVRCWSPSGAGDRFRQGHGQYETLRSLATLSFDCRRPDEFREQLIYALKVIERGDLSPPEMRGPRMARSASFSSSRRTTTNMRSISTVTASAI